MLYAYAVRRDRTMELQWQFAPEGDEHVVNFSRIVRRSCWTQLVHPDDRPKVAARLRRLLAGKPSVDVVRLCPPLDPPRTVRLWGWPERESGSGRVSRIIGRIDLLTPQPDIAAATAAETILAEMHHRTKNNFQSMIALLRMQAEAASDPGARAAMQQCVARVGAMALVHHQLSPIQGGGPAVHADTFLRFICANVLASHDSRDAKLTVAADPLTMDARRLTTLGMVVNELIVNALKHAFPGVRAGGIHVALYRVDDRTACLTVTDDGIGFPEGWTDLGSVGPGFGGRLIEAFMADLDGRIEVDMQDGTTVRITFPIAS